MPRRLSRVESVLNEGGAAVTGPIRAEVLSGARTSGQYERLRGAVRRRNRWLADPPVLWERVAEYRFALARGGFQAEIVDLAIAVAALAGGHRLLTRDRGFARIRTVVPIELDLF